MKRAIVAGATGLVGSTLVQQLLDTNQYEKIYLFARRITPFHNHPGVVEVILSFDDLDEYGHLFEEVSDVYITMGTTMKEAKTKEQFARVDYYYPLRIAELSKKYDVEKLLVVSSMGADRGSRFFYSRVKGRLEDQLILLDLPSLHIFRPSLIQGKRTRARVGEQLAELAMKPAKRLIKEKYQPVKADYIAALMRAVAKKPNKGVHVFESDIILKTGEKLFS